MKKQAATMYSNINEFLEVVKERPSMFVMDHSLHELFKLLTGWEMCSHAHGLVERTADKTFDCRSFADWLYETRGWSGCRGFASAILEHTANSQEAWSTFFTLKDEFLRDA